MSSRRVSKQARSTASAVLGVVISVLVLGIILAAVWLGRLVLGDFGSGVNRGSVEVPAVLGLDMEAARQTLGQAGFTAKEVQREYSPTVPAGHVIVQNPEAGLSVKRRQVSLVVSLGPASFVVPELFGEHLSKVPASLRKQGFRLNSVQRVFTKQYASGRVISQNPKKGEEFNNQDIGVDVVVADSTNLPKVDLPDLAGKPLAFAEDLLTRKEFNLRLGLVEYVADDSRAPLSIISQDPAGNSQVVMGAKVSLKVAAPTSFMTQRQRNINLRLPVPNGPDEQKVKVKLFDSLGEQVVLDETHHPGEVLEKSISTEGPAKILIFIGSMDSPLREDRL